MKVKEMKSMIVKGWDKIGITKAFGIEFQLAALEANTSRSLFTIIQGRRTNGKISRCKPNISIMEENL
jgi:hypothetical protein